MEINLRRIKANKRVRVMTLAEVTSVTGDTGNYSVDIKHAPRYVNDNCTACGACTAAVETEFDDEYHYGLKKRKGAYLPFFMAYPQRYIIDPRLIGTADVDKAKAACQYEAIDMDMAEENLTLNVGAIKFSPTLMIGFPMSLPALNLNVCWIPWGRRGVKSCARLMAKRLKILPLSNAQVRVITIT